jgi:hypothetical protein
MFNRRLTAGLIAVAALLLVNGCATALAGLLVYELLDDEAPVRTYTGTVRDTNGDPVGGLLVQMRAEVVGDSNVVHFSDTTNLDGDYTIKFRWNEDVNYSIRVIHEGTVYAEESLGHLPLQDQQQDFTITL